VKERPIIFSAPMVRALLAGAKTQTRRIVNLPADTTQVVRINCPYGVAGDRLWVRETWCRPSLDAYEYITDDRPRGQVIDGVDLREAVFYKATDPNVFHCEDENRSPWRSPIFMPRWASRITLEVTGVRVERLQDISEDDAISEGVSSGDIPADEDGPRRIGYMLGPDDGKSVLAPTARSAFFAGWSSIHGEASVAADPWVWVVQFKRAQQIAKAA